jgi:hypothetical protein
MRGPLPSSQMNVGAALKPPTGKNTLAERILSETQVYRLLALEPNHRNQVLLRLLYAAACASPSWRRSSGAIWCHATMPAR